MRRNALLSLQVLLLSLTTFTASRQIDDTSAFPQPPIEDASPITLSISLRVIEPPEDDRDYWLGRNRTHDHQLVAYDVTAQQPIEQTPIRQEAFPTTFVYGPPADASKAMWTRHLLCSHEGCIKLPSPGRTYHSVPTFGQEMVQTVCQNSLSHTATITAPPSLPTDATWASELIFSKTAGKDYCSQYPGSIARCMIRYTRSYRAPKLITTTETATEYEKTTLADGRKTKVLEIETETEVETTHTIVPGPHWGDPSPTATKTQRRSCHDETSCIAHCEHEHRSQVNILAVLGGILGVTMLISLAGMLMKRFRWEGEGRRIVLTNTPRVGVEH